MKKQYYRNSITLLIFAEYNQIYNSLSYIHPKYLSNMPSSSFLYDYAWCINQL